MDTLVIGAGASALAIVVAAVLLPAMARESRVDARVRAVANVSGVGSVVAASTPWWDPIAGIGRLVIASGVLSRKTVDALGQTAAINGARSEAAVSLFLGVKILLMVGLPIICLLGTFLLGIEVSQPLLLVAVPAVVGMIAPDVIVRRIRKKYVDQVERGLPGALDLMIVCAEAGLTIEVAFDRVSVELREGNGPCANELRMTSQEMKLLPDRRQALANMGDRTGLDSLRNLGGTLSQSIQYGTPMTQALRVLADEMRHAMLMRYEARAARLPVLLTIPMILFILPCTFVVIGGPAAVQVVRMMRGH